MRNDSACTRPRSASACGTDQHRSKYYGYEKEWEEAHNEQKDDCTQDDPPGERRTSGSEEDQRQEEGPCAEDCGSQSNGPQGTCEAGSSEKDCRKTRSAKEKGRGEKACRSQETGSCNGSRAETGSTGPEARPGDAAGAVGGIDDAAAASRPDGRWHAPPSGRRHGNARTLHRRHAGRKLYPQRATLPAVLGERRRRYVVEGEGGRGGHPSSQLAGVGNEAAKSEAFQAVEPVLGEVGVVE